jgi:bisphosphoglycerate-dependent phosphoglycerate mutase
MANKPKYSKELAERIAGMIESSNHTIDEICSLSGITKVTFYEWKKTKPYFVQCITRAEEKKTETLVVEAKHSLRKLIRGIDEVETKVETKNLKNGDKQVTYTLSDKHTPADFRMIRFVLENKDSKNFRSKIHRVLKFHERRSRKA